MQEIKWGEFSPNIVDYINGGLESDISVAEGAIRVGKTIANCIIAMDYLEHCQDRIHLASGSTVANAKINIGDCNGFGLEHLFKGRCKWSKYKDNEALKIHTKTGEKIVIFAGGGKRDSYKKILGNSYGLWIATEINQHYDNEDSKVSFIKVAIGRQLMAKQIKRVWDLNPDNPNHSIYSYIDEWAKKYNYKSFSIYDNWNFSKKRIEMIKDDYVEGSVWYNRDILGLRVVAAGLIYEEFANNRDKYKLDKLPKRYLELNIGLDFGGNGSKHSIVATGITRDLDIIGLECEISSAQTDKELRRWVREFVEKVYNKYDQLDYLYYDNAETVLGNSIKAELQDYDMGVKGARKSEILKRIRTVQILINRDKLFIQNQNIAQALSFAVWDSKVDTWVRLDNGTSDIDTLDAFEYSFEKFINNITKGVLYD